MLVVIFNFLVNAFWLIFLLAIKAEGIEYKFSIVALVITVSLIIVSIKVYIDYNTMGKKAYQNRIYRPYSVFWFSIFNGLFITFGALAYNNQEYELICLFSVLFILSFSLFSIMIFKKTGFS